MFALFESAFTTAATFVRAKLLGVAFPTGNATIIFTVSLFSGIQLLSLGIMGEYVGRIYDEVKHRPLYIVREERNAPSAARGPRAVRDSRAGLSARTPERV